MNTWLDRPATVRAILITIGAMAVVRTILVVLSAHVDR